MKKIIALCMVATALTSFAKDDFSARRKLANEIVMGENTDFCLNSYPAEDRVCIIVKGTAVEVASNRCVKIGSSLKDRALFYLYFNDVEEITNAVGRGWKDIDKEGLYQISNKVWYCQLKYHNYKNRKDSPLSYCSFTETFVAKRGFLWEISSFSSALERMADTSPAVIEELENTMKMIFECSKLTGIGFKAKFKKLVLYARSGCMCKLSNYYNYAFGNARNTHYSVEMKIDGERFYGYVEKDSYFGKVVFDALSDGNPHKLSMGISYPLKSDENGGGWAEHVVIVYASEHEIDPWDEDELKVLAKLQMARMKFIRKEVKDLGELIERSSILPRYEVERYRKKYIEWKRYVKIYDLELDYERQID